MTPGERQFDLQLVISARKAARTVAKRSGKISLIINQLCDRLDALSSAAPIDQPASTPDPAPVTGNGTSERL